MEMSQVRSSSALGVLPMPYLGDCASAVPPRSSTSAASLSKPIAHTPIADDPPRHDDVVQSRRVERIERYVEVLGDLGFRRLNLAEFVRAARHDLGLFSVPVPLIAEPSVRHTLRRPFDFGDVPFLAAVGGNL